MRLILEKTEIVAVLSKHFEAALDPDKVIIRTDPFEIEVCGLPLADAPPPEEANVTQLRPRQTAATDSPRVKAPQVDVKDRDDPDATTEPPPPGKDGTEGPATADVHPAAVLAASKALEQELDRENPQLKRRAGRYSHTPPDDFKDEIP